MNPQKTAQAWQQITSGQAQPEDFMALSTLLTGALLHGSWEHILYNLLSLWIFAGLVGELIGARWMSALLLITALCGSLGDLFLRAGSHIPSLGASGMVMGFEGAYLGLAVRWTLPNPYIWPISYPIPPSRLMIMAAVGFALDISGTISGTGNTAYGAHLGGFLSGLLFTSFIIGRPRTLAS